MSHFSFFIFIFLSSSALSQKKWDGGGSNNQWNNALNWSGNTLPSITDDVVLDNSLVASNYTVELPPAAVTVRTITISPAASGSIELTLTPSNTLVPGLTVTGPGYGLTINSGGVFRNSSGSTSGNTVRVTDSIRINNDGKYVHNSVSGHSANVAVLAKIAGTERGIMELDIPSASSTISISGRTFGKFVLRSTAAGGTCNYTASGTGRVSIRHNLDIGPGVNFSINCGDTIFVSGDLLQQNGTLNLGNSIRSVVLAVFKNITQHTGGTITETGTGTQTILFNGTGLQQVDFKGTISNQVVLVKDAVGTVLSMTPVSIPYKLKLKNGKIVTNPGLITLQSACTLEADTLSTSSFIDGPLKKEGLSNQSFLFPVGKSGSLRWLQLENATGNFTVEYIKTDPKTLSNSKGPGIDHISSVEYWDVTTTAVSSSNVKLSFVHPNSGTITNLSALRVARLINGTWEDAGNNNVSGTPGSDGWVSSNAAGGFSANSKSFALASAMGLENPLPLSSIKLKGERRGNTVMFMWMADKDICFKKFELQKSFDGTRYTTIYEGTGRYNYVGPSENKNAYFRIKAEDVNEVKEYTSNIIFLLVKQNQLSIYVVADVNGRVVKLFKQYPSALSGSIKEHLSALPLGVYFIKELSGNTILKYFKR